jgi:hypothetical protein
MKEKVLIFYNENSKNYWFHYVKDFLVNNNMNPKVYRSKYKISILGNNLKFISERDAKKYAIGRHDALFIHNVETKFEREFLKTLILILKE